MVVLRFTGRGTHRGSLRNGNYTLITHGSKITDASGRPLDGGDRVERFTRLLADLNGDGRVNRLDFLLFRKLYGRR